MNVTNNVSDRLQPKRQGVTPTKEAIDGSSASQVDALKALDTNKDGKLDRTEFTNSALYKSASDRERELLSKAFAAAASKADQIDSDAGYASLAEAVSTVPAAPTEEAPGNLLERIGDSLKAAYDKVKNFFGDLFSKMREALSNFLSWAGKSIENASNGFFDKFETTVTRRPEIPSPADARKRLRETEAAEAEALQKLSSSDQDAYKAIANALESDPVSRLILREMLLDGRLPGGKDLAEGKTLLQNLAGLATQPLLDGLDRTEILGEVLAHIDDPITISQEQQRTCGPTTGQLLLARQEPSEYVRLAAGLASPEGSVKLQNGKTIQREPDWNDYTDDRRTPVNRLFQSALMEYANGRFDYSNTTDAREVKIGPLDLDIPGLLPHEMARLLEGLTGRDYQIEYSVMSKKVGKDFQAALEQVGPGKEIPVILNYNVSEGGIKATSPHYILVTGYDAEAGTVDISNPWGREETISLEELQSHLIAAIPLA